MCATRMAPSRMQRYRWSCGAAGCRDTPSGHPAIWVFINGAALPPAGGGSMMGEGARDGCVEWMLSVLNGPRNGLADGVACAVWGHERTAEGWMCGATGVNGGCGTALYCACGGECEPCMGSSESVLMGDGEPSRAMPRWQWWR